MIGKLFASLAAISSLLCANAVLAQESSPTVTQEVPDVSGFRTEIITIPDPEALRSGEPMMAILYTPESGINIYSPAIVIIHGGLAGHPARQVGAARFAAERLAAKGYTVLSPMTRHSRDELRTKFEDIVYDIDNSLDALEARGIQRFVLAGHSMGSARIAYHQAKTQDPRVKALVHFAPTADMGGEGGVAATFLPDYEDKVRRAQAAVAEGRGNLDYGKGETGEGGLKTPELINAVAGYFYTAESFLSHWGPDTKARNSDIMPENTVPILMMAGTIDSAVPAGRMEKLKELATKSPKVDVISYDGVNHFFENVWDQSSNDTAEWLKDIGLAPERRVNVEIIDTRMGNGRHLPGILYVPENADPEKPAFILQHGWTGDIMHSSNHWLGQRLARAGHVVLAPQTRMSGPPGAYRGTLENMSVDLGKWVDAMDARGYSKIIMEGHSMGGLWSSNYVSRTNDPRIVGMVYLAPTRDVPTYLREGLGDKAYEELVADAMKQVKAGKGNSHFYFKKFRRPTVDSVTGPVSATLQLANTVVEYHGPKTRGYHTARVAEFDRPALAIAGRKDSLMTDEFIGRFTKAYKGDLTTVWYEDGSHGFRESKDRVADDILKWVKKNY